MKNKLIGVPSGKEEVNGENMKKHDGVLITVIIAVLLALTTTVGFFVGVEYQENSDIEGWVSINRIKMLSIPIQVEDGDQFDYVLVDYFVIENGTVHADPTYGFLIINETTNKIEFKEFR